MTVQSLEDKVERLKAFIHALLSQQIDKTFTVNVEVFDREGFRISEVGYWVPTGERTGGGASWLRSDPGCADAILACEEYVLWCDSAVEVYSGSVNGKYDPSIADLAQEVEKAVELAITGTSSPWVLRWPAGETVPEGTVWYDAEKYNAYQEANK